MTEKCTIVWFRQDLRVEDHPALFEAMEGGTVIPVYIWDERQSKEWPMGGASRWWLHYSLQSLANDLNKLGMKLIVRQGKTAHELMSLAKETGASSVYWSRCYEPDAIELESKIKAQLKAKGIEAKSFNASLLYEPWTIANKQGRPFQVFTPFWKTCCTHPVREILERPSNKLKAAPSCAATTVDALGLLPTIKWYSGLQSLWLPGTEAAKKRLRVFLKRSIQDYSQNRDLPSEDGVSMMSPHLHFGEISPVMIWQAVCDECPDEAAGQAYLRQLGWREFAYHLLYNFSDTPSSPLRKEFLRFPWRKNQKDLHAWQKGMTGYPIVDAGMRQLWTTGWMHNRVRMVVGSFLVKDLRISWMEGARWFWDTLVDADLANNTFGWQWVGGCGADAAPYFRIFNPMTQGEKFDPEGDYVRRWVPELANVPSRWIHCPWEAPEADLRKAGVILGKDYPLPIVDHDEARRLALAALKSI